MIGTEPTRRIDLRIEGMTCASCAARIEKRLGRVPGVTASVNFATERARVTYPETVTVPELLAVVSAAGYRARGDNPAERPAVDDDGTRAWARRFWVCLALSVPVLAWAMVPALRFPGWQWVSLAAATPVAWWGAWPIHAAAWVNLRHRAATMDTLVSVGVLAAFGWSVWALVFGDAGRGDLPVHLSVVAASGDAAREVYFEVAAVVTTLVVGGRLLEARARWRSGAALRALLDLGAKDVAVLHHGREVRRPVGELAVGDRFVVRPGEKIATDGVVENGTSAVDAALLTGESIPVEVGPGDAVTGATLNAGGRIVVRATRVGSETRLAQIAALVVDAQSGKAPVQRLVDRVAAVFVPAVMLLSVATLAVWLATGHDATQAFGAAVAVLIIACPCALGLATPTALVVGTGRGAQLGILIRSPDVLESTRRIDTVVFDKTGTVTTGVLRVTDVVAFDAGPAAAAPLLQLVGALEDASEHPVGRAIANAAANAADEAGHARAMPHVSSFAARSGLGVEGVVDGVPVVAGTERLLSEHGIAVTGIARDARDAAERDGRTAVLVACDRVLRGVVVVADAVRPTAADAVSELRDLGLRPMLLSGDNEGAARAVATAIGVDEVVAGVMPEAKVAVVRRLQSDGRVVAMVGDGVNDAAVLAQADLGFAMGTGTDAAIEASDVTLVRTDLHAVADAIRLARRTLRVIKGNLFWAFAYNVAALPVAAAGLLNPMIAAAAMAGSSVFVVSNSLRLRRFAPER